MIGAIGRCRRALGWTGLLLPSLALGGVAGSGEPAVVLDFAPPASPDGLPPGWEELNFRRIERKTRYTVVREGTGHVSRGESEAAVSGLYRRLDLDPRVYRILSWRWKVENVLARTDARRKEGDDYPARVYVAFHYDPRTATLWSGRPTAPSSCCTVSTRPATRSTTSGTTGSLPAPRSTTRTRTARR